MSKRVLVVKDYSVDKRFSRHGGAYDRGRADSWYCRPQCPHFFKGPSCLSEEVTEKDMTPDEIAAYKQGYRDNEREGGHKDW